MSDTPTEAAAQMERVLRGGEWIQYPSRDILQRLAVANIATYTGHLDYIAGRVPLDSKLMPVRDAYPDNFLLRCIVPDYHLTAPDVDDDGNELEEERDGRSKKYRHLGTMLTTCRDKMREFTVLGSAQRFIFDEKNPKKVVIKPVPMSPLTDADCARVHTLGYDRCIFDYRADKHTASGPNATKLYWQNIKISVQDSNLQFVINFIRAGILNKEKLYLKDFDCTIDCRGVFKRQEVFDYLKDKLGFGVRARSFSRKDVNSTILDNEIDVGNNCITWMTTIKDSSGKQFRVRLKLYLKLVQELECAAVRANVGQHIWDWLTSTGNGLAEARDATRDTGMTRAEITVYYDRRPATDDDGDACIVSAPFDTAYMELNRNSSWMANITAKAVQIVPARLIYSCPHAKMVQNWVDNIKHTLVVYDTQADIGLVCYGYNEVTSCLSAHIVQKNWSSLSRYIMQMLSLWDLPIDVITVHKGRGDGKMIRVKGKDVFHADGPKPIPMPQWVEQKLRLKPKKDADSNYVPSTFPVKNVFPPVDAELDHIVEGSIDSFFPPVHAQQQGTTTEAAAEAAGAAAGEAEDEADGADSDCSDAASVRTTNDSDGEEEDAEGDTEMEDADATVDENCDNQSTIVSILEKVEVPDDTCIISSTRFHRFSRNPDEPLVTRFTNAAGVGAAKVETPFAEGTRDDPVTDQRNKDVVTRLLVSSGFAQPAQTEDGPLQPVGAMVAEVPHTSLRASSKLQRYDLVQTQSFLPVNTLCIEPPKTFLAYKVWKPVQRGKRTPFNKWYAKVLAKRNANRQKERIRCIDTGVAERADMQYLHARTYAVIGLKQRLRSLAAKPTVTIAGLEPGSYPLLAVWRRGASNDTLLHDHVLFVTMADSSEPTPIVATGIINAGMKQHAAALDCLLFTGHGGKFYLDRSEPSSGTAIGTLIRTEGGDKKRKRGDSSGAGVVRPRNVGVRLEIGDIVVAESDLTKRAEQLAQTQVTIDTIKSSSDSLPVLQIETGGLKHVKDVTLQFPAVTYPSGLSLVVKRMATFDYGKKKNALVLEVYEQGKGPSSHVLIWATKNIAAAAVDLCTSVCVLKITKIMKTDVKVTAGLATGDWSAPSRQDYGKITAIAKGKPAQLQILRIDSVKQARDRDGNERVVIRDVDGAFWRFANFQHSHKFTLMPGYGINVPAWKQVSPASSGGAGCSTDPQ